MKRFFKLKYILLTVLIGLLFSALLMYYANNKIESNAEGKTFTSVAKTPHFKCGLLLGTSKLNKSGRVNIYYSKRITAAVQLFKAGKINYIIISGDNSRKTYDEPTDMKMDLVREGVDSNRIYLDYAGFRTFDSMVRCKEIFGQDSVLVISQQFHNERAIYIGEELGLTVVGYNAADVSKAYGRSTKIREAFARVKVLVDFMIGTEPKFLGEKIVIAK
ncbi:MAG: YdcF family protein [Bacteroidetes bacterium]|nr:YdcF family protein [Bacteroidota bacterium]